MRASCSLLKLEAIPPSLSVLARPHLAFTVSSVFRAPLRLQKTAGVICICGWILLREVHKLLVRHVMSSAPLWFQPAAPPPTPRIWNTRNGCLHSGCTCDCRAACWGCLCWCSPGRAQRPVDDHMPHPCQVPVMIRALGFLWSTAFLSIGLSGRLLAPTSVQCGLFFQGLCQKSPSPWSFFLLSWWEGLLRQKGDLLCFFSMSVYLILLFVGFLCVVSKFGRTLVTYTFQAHNRHFLNKSILST